jgi:hypothetical protein
MATSFGPRGNSSKLVEYERLPETVAELSFATFACLMLHQLIHVALSPQHALSYDAACTSDAGSGRSVALWEIWEMRE